MLKIFLGGTCAGTTWRNELISKLNTRNTEYFNPVVENWTEESRIEEQYQKKAKCHVHLYYITKEMKGVYSIAEVMDSFHMDTPTIFCFNPEGFDNSQLKSLHAVYNLMKERAEEELYFIPSICEVNSIDEVLALIEEAREYISENPFIGYEEYIQL